MTIITNGINPEPAADADERYTFTSATNIHKVDKDHKPDHHGTEYRLIEKFPDGFSVYVVGNDPSQPSVSYFIRKEYFI